MTCKKLRIAYISSESPVDPRAWSGTHYHMFGALAKYCGEVFYLGPLPLCIRMCSAVLSMGALIFYRIFNKSYLYSNSSFLSRLRGIFWAKKLSEGHFDLVFAPAATPDIAFLNTKTPIVYVGDATIALLFDYYPTFSNVLSISRKEADLVDRLAFSRSSLLVFPSEWAANSSVNHYGVNRNKVKIIPFGANIEKILRKRTPSYERRHVCRLLFIGKDWVRKGGELAVNTLLQLEKMGMQSKLVVCSSRPPKELSHRNVILVGWARKIDDLLSEADFLLLPTRAECFGIVFCEASAYGVPIISTDTGGVSGAVKNGENGFLLDITAGGADYAETIFGIWNDRRLYHNLQKKCMKAFSERLNWDSWGISMKRLIDEAIVT